jgi:probable rRNA maturation factor
MMSVMPFPDFHELHTGSLGVQYALSSRKGVPSANTLRRFAGAAFGYLPQQDILNPASDVCIECVLRVVDEPEIVQLNRDYRHKDYATNVLTFYYEQQADQGLFIGDIAICHAVIVREAHEQQKSVLAHYAHMVVHGVLHLQGWEHESDADHQAMMRVEAHVLKQLGFENPYQMDDFERFE